MGVIRKSLTANAKIGDALGLVRQEVLPVRVAVRFALLVAFIAFLISAVALARTFGR